VTRFDNRRQRRRETRQEIRRASDRIPLPNHPYRDSAIFYGVLSAILLGVTYWTGGHMLRAVLVAVGFFVLATAFSWYRFRNKLAEREQEESR
jgi:Flp pilus assembly protein TadB